MKDHKIDQGVELAKKVIHINADCQPAYLALGKAYTPSKKNIERNIVKFRQAKIYYERALDLAKSQQLVCIGII